MGNSSSNTKTSSNSNSHSHQSNRGDFHDSSSSSSTFPSFLFDPPHRRPYLHHASTNNLNNHDEEDEDEFPQSHSQSKSHASYYEQRKRNHQLLLIKLHSNSYRRYHQRRPSSASSSSSSVYLDHGSNTGFLHGTNNVPQPHSHNHHKIITSQTSILMGPSPPPLYEMALLYKGPSSSFSSSASSSQQQQQQESILLYRLQQYPNEILYKDKSNNTPLHLICRSKPTLHVMKSLCQIWMKMKFNNNNNQNRCDQIHIGGVTTDGQTCLHFACYCGASPYIIDLLLYYEYKLFIQSQSSNTTTTSADTGIHMPTNIHNTNTISSSTHSTTHMNSNTSTQSQNNNNNNNNNNISTSSSLYKLPMDSRYRTPLHLQCSSFRNNYKSSRPINIYLLLRNDPLSVCRIDGKGNTSFSLLYDDYVEEIEEFLVIKMKKKKEKNESKEEENKIVDKNEGKVKERKKKSTCTGIGGSQMGLELDEQSQSILLSEKGNLNECWKILILLFKAAYVGSIMDDDYDEEEEHDRICTNNDIDDENRSCTSNTSSTFDHHHDIKRDECDSNNHDKHDDDAVQVPTSSTSPSADRIIVKEGKNTKYSNVENSSLRQEEKKNASLSPIIDRSKEKYVKYNEDDAIQASKLNVTSSTAPIPSTPTLSSTRIVTPTKTPLRRNSCSTFYNSNANILSHYDAQHHHQQQESDTFFHPLTPSLLSFSLIHAAASIPYTCPYGFFQLLLKVCPSQVGLFDDGYMRSRRGRNGSERLLNRREQSQCSTSKQIGVLPLHLAAKCPPPTPLLQSQQSNKGEKRMSSTNLFTNARNLSTTFHGYSSSSYQDPSSGVTITYSQSKVNKNKQYHTVSFASRSSIPSCGASFLHSSSSSSSSLLKTLQGYPTPIITHLIDLYPQAASIPEPSSGKYPIELAIESGKSYHSVIDPLIDAYPGFLFSTTTIQGEIDFGIDRIFHSLSNALINPSTLIRNETVITIGGIIQRVVSHLAKNNGSINVNDSHNNDKIINDAHHVGERIPKDIDFHHRIQEFIKSLIRKSDGSFYNTNQVHYEDPYSHAHFLTDDEWSSIQSSTLLALSHAINNASPQIFENDNCTYSENNQNDSLLLQKALQVAENSIRHENAQVRESAANVMGATLNWLGGENVENLVDRIFLREFRQQKEEMKEMMTMADDQSVVSKLSVSMHSMFSGNSHNSIRTQKTSNNTNYTKSSISGTTGASDASINRTLSKRRLSINKNLHDNPMSLSTANKTLSRRRLSINNNQHDTNNKLSKTQYLNIQHGKALACLHILLSKNGKKYIIQYEHDLVDLARIIREYIFAEYCDHDDDNPTMTAAGTHGGGIGGEEDDGDYHHYLMVKQAACLAMGSILGRSILTNQEQIILKLLRHPIIKCMKGNHCNNHSRKECCEYSDDDLHIALARGLMIATYISSSYSTTVNARSTTTKNNLQNNNSNRRNNIFISKMAIPILENAILLSVSSLLPVQKMFHAFLWLALGVGDMNTSEIDATATNDNDQNESTAATATTNSNTSSRSSSHHNNTNNGLSEYVMSLAEGENGVIMMNIVTKNLVMIQSVHDLLWSNIDLS